MSKWRPKSRRMAIFETCRSWRRLTKAPPGGERRPSFGAAAISLPPVAPPQACLTRSRQASILAAVLPAQPREDGVFFQKSRAFCPAWGDQAVTDSVEDATSACSFSSSLLIRSDTSLEKPAATSLLDCSEASSSLIDTVPSLLVSAAS